MKTPNTVTLATSSAQIIIAPSLGGAMLAYDATINGVSRAIFKSSTDATDVSQSCNFPLVPFSNRIRDGQFDWQGKSIQLPLNFYPSKHAIHGHGWQNVWGIEQQASDSLTLAYHHQASDWPFDYRAEQRFSLVDNQLTLELSVTNTGNSEMPVGLGLHPYFTNTPQARVSANVSEMWAVDDQTLPTTLVTPPKSLTTPEGMSIADNILDNVFIQWMGQAKVVWPEWQAKATISTSKDCEFMVIYSPPGENFFCVEPVTHCTDAINLAAKGQQNTGHRSLAPGKTFTISMVITPSPL